MNSDRKQKAAEESRTAEAKAVEMVRKNAEKEIRERLCRLKDFLFKQSAFDGDNLSWAADCIQRFLDDKENTLDHAFGLRSSKKGRKPMQSGEHDDWVPAAWEQIFLATPNDKEWPDTRTIAEIGREYGLGGIDPASADDHGIASELKRILIRYKPIIVKQFSDELTAKWNEEP